MLKKWKKYFTCAFYVVFTLNVFAADLKFGYINVDRIFAEAKPSKELQAAMKAKYGMQQKQLEQLNATVLAEQKQIQQLSAITKPTVLQQQQLAQTQSQYQLNGTNLQQQYTYFQRSVQSTQEMALSLLMTKINTMLKKFSDKKDYDLLLTSNQLVFAKAKYDITDQVMEQINSIETTDIVKKINSQPSAILPTH